MNLFQKLPDEDKASNSSSTNTTITSLAAGPSTDNGQEQEDKDGDKDPKKKKNRCAMCRKKVGLTGEYGNKTIEIGLLHKPLLPFTNAKIIYEPQVY